MESSCLQGNRSAETCETYQGIPVSSERGVVNPSTSSLDSVLTIFNGAGTKITSNDDTDKLDPFITFNAPSTDTYYIAVSGAGNNDDFSPLFTDSRTPGSTGDYSLVLNVSVNDGEENRPEPNDTISEARNLNNDFLPDNTLSLTAFIGDNPNLNTPHLDTDLYQLFLNSGETLLIDIDSSSSLDSFVRIFNHNSAELAFNDNDSAPDESITLDSYLEFTPTNSGDYYLGVSTAANNNYIPFQAESGSGRGAMGTYQLNLTLPEREAENPTTEDPTNDTLDTAITLNLDDQPLNQSGTIGDHPDFTTVPGFDVDLYSVTLDADQELTIDVNATGTFDPILRLFNPEGAAIAFNDDGGDGNSARLHFTAPTANTYYLGISGFGNDKYNPNQEGSGNNPFASTGNYTLTLTPIIEFIPEGGAEEPNDTISNATPTNLSLNNRQFTQTYAIGNNNAFSLEQAGLDVDLFQVELDANTRLTADINTENLDSNFDSLLRIIDSAGNPIPFAFNDDETPRTTDSFLEFVPDTPGTYYVGVSGVGNEAYNPTREGSGNNGSRGEYEINLSLSEAVPAETPENDTLNSAVAVTLTNNRFGGRGFLGDNPNVDADVDFYQLELNTQDTLNIAINGDNLESFVRFFNSDGQEITLEYDAGDFPDPEISVTIPEDGFYYLGISAFDNDEYDPTVADSGLVTDSVGQYALTLKVDSPPPAALIEAVRPTANDDSFRAEANLSAIFNVLGNDSANDDQGVLEITDFPAITEKGGTLELDNQSRLVYTPDPEFGGVDTFTYTITNESGGIDQGTVEVNVNRPPDGASVQVELEVRAVPGQGNPLQDGLQIGDEFLVDVRFLDLVNEDNSSQAIRSGYADLLFDPNILQIVSNPDIDTDELTDGIIRYNDYPTTRKGTVRNQQGLVDEVGAFSMAFNPPEENRIFSLHFQAIGGGNTALLASESPEQGTSAITLFDTFLTDQRGQTNFGEIDLASVTNPNNVGNALAVNLANNNAIALQQGEVSGVQGIIEAMRVTIDFQDLEGDPINEVEVGDEFKIVLSAEDLRPEGQQLGVFSVFADVIYDTVLIDVDEANLLGNFQSPVLDLPTAIAQGSGEGLVDELGGTNANFAPIRTGTQEFAELIVTATAPGELEISTNAGEGATSQNTLFGVDVEVTEGTTYSQKSLNIVGETPEGNADLVITEFDAVIDHVLGGETTVNLTVENIGDGVSPGFQVEILYYRADDLEALTTEEPMVVKTIALEELAAGDEINETITEVSLPVEVMLAEALEDDPSVFGQLIPEEGFFESNNVDYLGVRLVSSESSGEDIAGFENNGVTGEEGVNVDDIAYFPWDFVDNNGLNVVQGGEDSLETDQLVTPVDANFVFENIGEIISEEVIESQQVGTEGLDLSRIDLDLDGAISPVDAVRVVNRIGYGINPDVVENGLG